MVLCVGLGAGLLMIWVGDFSTSPVSYSLAAAAPRGAMAKGLHAMPRPLVPDRRRDTPREGAVRTDVLGQRATDLPMAPEPETAWERAQSESVSAPWEEGKGQGSAKIVYLTFDDGPFPRWTEEILERLEMYDARATFFQLGEMRRDFPDLVDLVEATGNRVGNHGYDHEQMTGLQASEMRAELSLGPTSRCFRPPYGAVDNQVEKAIAEAGMRTVMWTVDSLDWRGGDAELIANRVLTRVDPGDIVLMHDGGSDRSETVAALDLILPDLARRGYQFHALPC